MRITRPATLLLFGSLAMGRAQPPPPETPPAQAPAASNATDVASQDAGITFQSKVNLVLVPVVVRDKKGKPVDGLTKDDFQLFDKGRPQTISRFAVEKAGAHPIPPPPKPQAIPGALSGDASAPDLIAPDHYVALFFDDIHLSFADLVQARQAARRYVLERLRQTERAAIYTTSGQTALDFTDDRLS